MAEVYAPLDEDAERPMCDSCGAFEEADNPHIECQEEGHVYRYCDACYAP